MACHMTSKNKLKTETVKQTISPQGPLLFSRLIISHNLPQREFGLVVMEVLTQFSVKYNFIYPCKTTAVLVMNCMQ